MGYLNIKSLICWRGGLFIYKNTRRRRSWKRGDDGLLLEMEKKKAWAVEKKREARRLREDAE